MYQRISNRQEEFVQYMIEQPEIPQTEANGEPLEQQSLSQALEMQGKLVLHSWEYQTTSNRIPTVRPEQLVRPISTPSPASPLAKLRYFWGKDPAYKVLFIAIGMVLIGAVAFGSLVGTTLLSYAGFFGQASLYVQNAPTAVVPSGTLDLHPKFPTPGGGQGSGSSSQPPPQSTVILQNTPDNTPTTELSPTPNPGGELTLQITHIPSRVTNGSSVPVEVRASQPNVSVELYIVYNAEPYRAYAEPSTADGDGNATITWSVLVFKLGNASANVTAIAQDSGGQVVESQTVAVQVGRNGSTG